MRETQLWHCQERASFHRPLFAPTTVCRSFIPSRPFVRFLFAYYRDDFAQLYRANTKPDDALVYIQHFRPNNGGRCNRPCDVDVFAPYRESRERRDLTVKRDRTPRIDASTHARNTDPHG